MLLNTAFATNPIAWNINNHERIVAKRIQSSRASHVRENISTIIFANTKSIIDAPTTYQNENFIELHTVSVILSNLFAPRFCHMIGHIAPERANITAKATGETLPIILIPATALSQKSDIAFVTYAFQIGVAKFVSIAGIAIKSITGSLEHSSVNDIPHKPVKNLFF